MKIPRKRSRPDSGLRSLFRRHVPPPVHWLTIETGGTAQGVPDANYCADGVDGWIEYKCTRGWTCPLGPEQVAWISRRIKEGGCVFVATRRLVEAGPRRSAADELWIHSGEDAPALRADGLLVRTPMGQWAGGPARWNWRQIREMMTMKKRST